MEDIAGVRRGEGRPLPRRASTVGLVDVPGGSGDDSRGEWNSTEGVG